MIVLRVWVVMPELPPLLLLALDRLAVGVDTESDVELLSDPSEAVTMTTVVAVVGVALSVVEAAVLSAEVVWLGGGFADVSSEAVLVCAGCDVLVEVGGGAASLDVVAVVVAAAVVVASVVVCAAEVDAVSDVEVWAAEVVSLVVVAATVLPLPLASTALSESEPCRRTNALLSWPKIAALIKKP